MAVDGVDLDDIQGLVRSGYGDLPQASYLLLQVIDRAAAKAWLQKAPVTNARFGVHQRTALHVAVTAPGLCALGLKEDALAGFSAEFLSGMTGETARSRRLGDAGPNAPERWAWGWADRVPHVLVMLYATSGQLAAWRNAVTMGDFSAGFHLQAELGTADELGREPFGFRDGLSQPLLDWKGKRRPPSDEDLEYGNLIAPGEFILGYGNEYGFRTDRPLLPRSDDPAAILPLAEGQSDLGRNGSYLVMRQLDQDVRRFWQFLAAQVPADQVVELAEAMVGRRRHSGEPLAERSRTPIRGVGSKPDDLKLNRFTFEADPDGLRCPLGAHIRRANPRNGDMPGGRQGPIRQLLRLLGLIPGAPRADVIASSRFHRILRRGRPYGDFLDLEAALAPASGPPGTRGLHFICLNANIARQFEFIQNAWLSSSKFGGLSEESDPLLGNRLPLAGNSATDGFTIQHANGKHLRVCGLPPFITVRGGAYFFLPGLRAIRYLATLP